MKILPSASFFARQNNSICRFINRVLYHCQIGDNTIIPKSIYLGHDGVGTIIGEGVKIGENVTIYPNVTIGKGNIKNMKITDDYPNIGNNVTICPGSILIGKIKIGDNVTIGPGSIVDKDIPDDCTFYKNIIVKHEQKSNSNKDK